MHIYAVWGELRFPELTFAQLQFYSQLLLLSLRAVTGTLVHRFVPFSFNLFICTRCTEIHLRFLEEEIANHLACLKKLSAAKKSKDLI